MKRTLKVFNDDTTKETTVFLQLFQSTKSSVVIRAVDENGTLCQRGNIAEIFLGDDNKLRMQLCASASPDLCHVDDDEFITVV